MTHPTFVTLFAPLLLLLAGCGPKATTKKPTPEYGRGDIMDTSTWDYSGGELKTSTPTTPTQKLKDKFAIVIATFTGKQHEQLAGATLTQLARQYPSIGQKLNMQPRSRGTALTYGNYKGYDDPEAQKDIDMLHNVPDQDGRRLFPQIMLMKFKGTVLNQKLHPHDLWTVRREYPLVVPIYTLEIAVWGDFDSGHFPLAKRRDAAEKYAANLRTNGLEAFFFHNDDAGLSSVTVGLFGFNALDAETGFYSPEVESMMSRFPKRLVNGQEVLQYFNPSKPELGANVQRPVLAVVPVD